MIMKEMEIAEVKVNTLFEKIAVLIDESRKKVSTAINLAEVYTKYSIGKYIMEDEQEGNVRAAYGKKILEQLSHKLEKRFGKGWSIDVLKRCRQFYCTYSTDSISATVLPQLPFSNAKVISGNNASPIQSSSSNLPNFILSWSHYMVLMRVPDSNARKFYEIECSNQNWSVRWLQRQINSSLYERLALSKDKSEVLRLSQEGQTIEKPADIIKNPITLEFLGLKPETVYSETKLESAIIDKMQEFLLEMGKGFLFEKRQRRFTFDEDNYYIDLVFYNRLLQCYVLIDLKIDKLTHQDLGQMQMYVNYYDRYVKQDFEKPTIGILLCKEKKDALIKLTLPDNANIYAAEYALYLPDKQLLMDKLKAWIEEYEQNIID